MPIAAFAGRQVVDRGGANRSELFVDQILNGRPITITDPAMTRFMMTLEDAVELVMFAFKNATGGDIFVQKAPAVTIGILAKSICDLMGKPNHEIRRDKIQAAIRRRRRSRSGRG